MKLGEVLLEKPIGPAPLSLCLASKRLTLYALIIIPSTDLVQKLIKKARTAAIATNN